MRLENFATLTPKANTSPDEMEFFYLRCDSNKTSTRGHTKSIGEAKHLNALLCPISSFFMSMMWRLTSELCGMMFPISVGMVESLKRDGYNFPK